jgi:hypothetical protein
MSSTSKNPNVIDDWYANYEKLDKRGFRQYYSIKDASKAIYKNPLGKVITKTAPLVFRIPS